MTTRIIHAPQLWMCGMKKATIGRHQGDTLINSFDCPRILIPQGFHLFQATCGKGAVGGDRATPGRQISRENAGKWLRIGVLGCLGDAALVIAMVMVLGLTSMAWAANGSTASHIITLNNSDQIGTHTYDAYQVFAGDYDEASSKLSNITWGNGVDGDAILAAVKSNTTILGTTAAADVKTAEDVAKLLGTGTDTNKAKAFAAIVGAHLGSTVAGSSTFASEKYTILVTGDGYYFIKDRAGTLPTDIDGTADHTADSETRYILQVVHDVTINAKSDTVKSDKKIGDTNDTEGTVEGSRDSADYDIGDTIPYTLTATLPANYTSYDKYYLQFVDDMSAGLTLDADSVKIYYGNDTAVTATFTQDTTATSTYTGGKVYKLTISDLKTTDGASGLTNGSVVKVTYTAKLNANAVVGEVGNPNKSHIVFSNNPNNTGDGNTGTTPDDTVIAFTYDVEIDKVTGETTALNGAAFALYKLFKDDAELTAVNAKRAAADQYEKATSITYDNGTKTYAIGTDVWALVEQKNVGTSTNVFNFSGVDDGTYLLVETTTPAGYNSIKPSKFTITAVHTDGDTPTYADPTATSVNDANHTPISLGVMTRSDKKVGLKANVVNNEGVQLPSTGGIGTTIFYVIGAILVLGAGILLVTRRRVSAN